MKLKARYIPNLEFPHDDIMQATKVQAKLYPTNPVLALFPKTNPDWGILERTFSNMEFFSINNGKIKFKPKKYNPLALGFESAFNNLQPEFLSYCISEEAFSKKFFSLINKFKPPHATINLFGPFSAFQLFEKSEISTFSIDNKKHQNILIRLIIIKALGYITKIKEISPSTTPLIILEEPYLHRVATMQRMNEIITPELITDMFRKIANKIREAGGATVIQSFEKCDWRIPMNAGVDMISFGAYSNSHNLTVFPKEIMEFIENGGKINWSIIHATNENTVKSLNVEQLLKTLTNRFELLVSRGVPANYVYNSASVSIQNPITSLPLIHAEKVMILLTQLATRIPIISK